MENRRRCGCLPKPFTETAPACRKGLKIARNLGRRFSSQDAIVLRQDGTAAPLALARRSCPAPGPRYGHTMVPVPMPVTMPTDGDGGDAAGGSVQVAFLFGGCRGDGTRVAEDEAFVLDLRGGGGSDAAGGGAGEGADEGMNGVGVDGEDAQVDWKQASTTCSHIQPTRMHNSPPSGLIFYSSWFSRLRYAGKGR